MPYCCRQVRIKAQVKAKKPSLDHSRRELNKFSSRMHIKNMAESQGRYMLVIQLKDIRHQKNSCRTFSRSQAYIFPTYGPEPFQCITPQLCHITTRPELWY